MWNVIVVWIKNSPQPTTLIVDKERQTQLSLIKHYVPKFNKISKKDTVNIIITVQVFVSLLPVY